MLTTFLYASYEKSGPGPPDLDREPGLQQTSSPAGAGGARSFLLRDGGVTYIP